MTPQLDIADLDAGDSKAHPSSKKRRTPGACDLCKKKKIRCDSAEMPGNRCSNCIHLNVDCTHKEVTKTLGSAKSYVESLESRLERMEKLFNKLLPTVDLQKELDRLLDSESTPDPIHLPRNDDNAREGELTGKLGRLEVNPRQSRFFGKSSGYQLIQTALDIRQAYAGDEPDFESTIKGNQRPEFWQLPPWRPTVPELLPAPPGYVFPDEDLINPLVTAYFEQVNLFLPLFHRPTFEQNVASGLHHRDPSFGGTLLLVCALGSRHSDDPRVIIEGSNSPQSAGWKWFEQVPVMRKSLVQRPTLFELQNHALSLLYAHSTEAPHGCWTQLGVALRMAQEVGAHRRRLLKAPTAEDEHWKRAFWVLLCLDRLFSSSVGRQCILRSEDYDSDLPIECDDEYWNHPDPKLNFCQPEKKPSVITFFNCYIQLMNILGYTMRYIYSVRPSKLRAFKRSLYTDQQVIVDLDSAMNSWMASIPDHLRWNPKSADRVFLKQSATLYAMYYHLQIFIHRPFIPSPRNPAPTTFPSLAICTNAARSCCHVLEVQSRTDMPVPTAHITIFTAAVVLLLNIWSGKRSGYAPHPQREIEDVQKCITLLKACERRWCSAGRYLDVLTSLASAGDVAFSSVCAGEPPPSHKRPRESEEESNSSSSSWTSTPPAESRAIAGSRRVLQKEQHGNASTQHISLPMYSDELGRLPVYGQINFSDTHPPYLDHTRDLYLAMRKPEFAMHFEAQLAPSMDAVQDGYVEPVRGGGHSRHAFETYPVHWNEPGAAQQQQQQSMPLEVGADGLQKGPMSVTSSFSTDRRVENGAFGEMSMIDNDVLSMWSSAPKGFELNEWDTYITSVNQMTQMQSPSGFFVNGE